MGMAVLGGTLASMFLAANPFWYFIIKTYLELKEKIQISF
jgi:hypothetical protein